MRRLILGWILVLALAACGSKGPLYLPDSKPAPKAAAKPQASSGDSKAQPQ